MKLERQFSKELAGDLRKETADKLRKARKIPANFLELKNKQKSGKDILENDEFWSDNKEDIEKLKKDVWGRILKTEKYLKRESQLNELLKFKKKFDTKNTQEEYKKRFNEILKDCPLSLDEREKYLSTESMEKMALDDYLILLKRLSGEAFYHVTRYGVRENTFMSTGGGHTEGKNSFIDSFNPLLKDGRINSFVSTMTNKDSGRAHQFLTGNREGIEKLINDGKNIDEIIDEVMHAISTVDYLDRESAHFSYGKDLNHMYGGEKDYKFYFYYPVEYILQNDYFHKTRETQINIGQGYYHNQVGIDQQYNDIEIFNFGKGVPINAGILCITGNIDVDPKTGFQYVLKNGKPEVGENNEFKKPEETISSKEYWEKYFEVHPELKPNKIIYGNFSTWTHKKDEKLEKWAEDKKVWNQDEEKKREFDNYRNSNRELLRKIFKDIIKEEFGLTE